MKKSLMVLAASALVLFAACKKEETNKGYVINGDQITFGVGMATPQDNDKQSYNGQEERIFFTLNDSMIINGAACRVFPQLNPFVVEDIPSTTTEFSPWARVTTTLSNGVYDFYYPAKIFGSGANATNENGQFLVSLPNDVRCLNVEAENNHFDSIYPTYDDSGRVIMSSVSPVWPMYYHIEDLSAQSVVRLKNTTAFIAPRVTYGPEWANKIFGHITGETYTDATAPQMVVWDGYIRTNTKITGNGYIDVTDTANPLVVLTDPLEEGFDELHFDIEDFVGTLIPSSSNQAMTMLGMFPVPAGNVGNSWQLAISMTTTVNGQYYTMIYRNKASNVTDLPTLVRNKRYNLLINMRSISKFCFEGPNHSYYVNFDDDFDTKLANHEVAHVELKSGDLFICDNQPTMHIWRNQNIWVVNPSL